MEKNNKLLLIAKWLNWPISNIPAINVPKELSGGDDIWYSIPSLEFESNSNWQWLCLEKITEELSIKKNSDGEQLYHVGDITWFISHYTKSGKIKSKQDLFEAIVNYITDKKYGT